MPLVGFEPSIPAFERTKTVYSLDRAATVLEGGDGDLIEVLSRNLRGGTEENHEKFAEVERCPNRDMSLTPFEHL